jgi:hypothetical protein
MRNRWHSPIVRLLCAAFLCLGSISAQDPALKETFQQAKALWATQGDKDGASSRFEQVLAVLEPKAGSLSSDWVQVLCETYNWIAVLDDRTPAKRARVQKDLESILALNSDFDIDRNITNARLQGVFDGLRAAKLGRVKLTVSPDGGSLTLDGKPSSLGTGGVKFLTPGAHTLAYAKPGYQLLEQHLDLALKDNKALDFTLTRTSSTVTFNTYPTDAEIYLDDKKVGITHGQAPASALPMAAKLGLTAEQLSSDFVLGDLTPGKHVIEVRASCFKTKRVSLGEEFSTPFADHLLEPMKLEPSKGSLTISSTTPSGELFLSGKSYGSLPVNDLQICSGTYDLQVKFATGGFSQRVEVGEGKAISLQIRPKPRLTFLGFANTDDFAGRDRILNMLLGLGDRLKEVAYNQPSPKESAQDAAERLKASKDTEMTLLAVPVPGKPIHQIELILSTIGGEEEHYLVKPLETDPLESLVTKLNAQITLSEPWTGMTLLDVSGEPGPWVVQEDAVALKAGVKLSKAITTVNGKPVPSVQAFRKILKEFKGDKLTVTQGDSSTTLALSTQPVELPINASNLCYPFVLADLRLRYLGAKGDDAALLRLDQALALMHFRQYDKALEVLRDARMSTVQGVCQGTLDYYTGICLLRLGNVYLSEAAQAFNQALKYPQATLFGPEGPMVSILAKQALEDLKP